MGIDIRVTVRENKNDINYTLYNSTKCTVVQYVL